MTADFHAYSPLSGGKVGEIRMKFQIDQKFSKIAHLQSGEQSSLSCIFRCFQVIWNRVLWPFSSASYIYGIYYLENRRKQAKIQGNEHNVRDTFYMEKEKNTETHTESVVYYYKNRHLL